MLEIRVASADEADDLTALVRRAYAPYVPRIGREPAPMSSDYAALIGEGRVRVAILRERIVGLLVTVPHPDHLLVENVAVDPEAHGQGIGGALLAAADAEAERLGLPELRLYTNAAMTENLAYYPKRGFVETGRRTEHGFERVYFTRER
ncbi:GNAT family N-acetyltransferase [Leucobacter japonicus]|uniref:GNAT family N-acetyltransferase n=1 Tax=Leucobacter japonicus TaxID=1461259 RepID=UPI0006A79CE6|nr:GNAT family N-acetyltransferase [Leucobacter japonicus]